MKRATLIELNAVVAVAVHRSFRKAADELNISTSTLSHAVTSLEETLGVRLFNRTTRSVAVTEAGEQFLKRIQPALGQIQEAMIGANEFRKMPAGTLRINASEGAAKMILTPIVLKFLKLYPDMQVDIVTEGRMVDIVAQGFDAGIRTLDTVPLDMVAIPCSPPIRFMAFGSPSYFHSHGVPTVPSDLKKHRCIRTRLPSGAFYNWEFQRGTEKVDVNPQGPLILDNYNLMIAAAVNGAGIAWTHEWALTELLEQNKILEVLSEWSPELPGIYLYYPKHRHLTAGMKAFLEVVRGI